MIYGSLMGKEAPSDVRVPDSLMPFLKQNLDFITSTSRQKTLLSTISKTQASITRLLSHSFTSSETSGYIKQEVPCNIMKIDAVFKL
jgi:hypothetical protein